MELTQNVSTRQTCLLIPTGYYVSYLLLHNTPKLSSLKQHIISVSLGQESEYSILGSSESYGFSQGCNQGVNPGSAVSSDSLIGEESTSKLTLVPVVRIQVLVGYYNENLSALLYGPIPHSSLLYQSVQAKSAINSLLEEGSHKLW